MHFSKQKESYLKSKKILFWLILLVFSFIFAHASQAESGVKVVSVADGDTITISENGKEQKIRFYGIDCPEGDQQFGQQAKHFTSAMVSGRNIQIKPMDTDRYGRTVALVYTDGINLNEQIVAQGIGWMYRQYCKESFCSNWLQLESAARASRKGLWSNADPTPPWEYRQQQRASGGFNGHDLTVSPTNVQAQPGTYHGNTRSKVFHGSACKDFNCPNCTVNSKQHRRL